MKRRKEEYKEGSAGLEDVLGFLIYVFAFLMITIGLWNMITDQVMLAQKPNRIPRMELSEPYYLIQPEDLFYTGLIILAIALSFSFLLREKKDKKNT